MSLPLRAAFALLSAVLADGFGGEGRQTCTVVPARCDPAPVVTRPVLDAWSDLYTFVSPDTKWWMSPVHATLMPDGEVLFFGFRRDEECPTNYGCQPSFTFDRHAWTMPAAQAPTVPYTSPSNCYPTVPSMGKFVVYEDRYYIQEEPLPEGHDAFCSGHTLLSDGSVFTAGGTYFPVAPCQVGVCGLSYGTVFDRYTGVWEPTGNMVGQPDTCPPLPCASCEDPSGKCPSCKSGGQGYGTALRWYPTCTRLYDGSVLVTGGLTQTYVSAGGAQIYEGLQNNSIERFRPASRSFELVLPADRLDLKQNKLINQDYTHVAMLPSEVSRGGVDYDLLMFGQHGVPLLLDLDGPGPAQLWESGSAACRPASLCPNLDCHGCPGIGVSSALLPMRLTDGEWGYSNGSMLLAGGAHDTSHNSSLDVYDPVQDEWLFARPRRSLDTGRHHPSTVLLPDGKVLVVAGHNNDDDQEPLSHALYVDPRRDFRLGSGIGRMNEPGGRGYHSIALLLPDGRVLVAGGRDQQNERFFTERPTFEYLYPPYFSRSRPRILVVNDVMRYGKSYDLYTDVDPGEVVLIGLGSMTHSFDMNQRSVQIDVKPAKSRPMSGSPPKVKSTISIPDDARLLPPGHYMLFVLDGQNVPSKARVVHVGNGERL